METSNQKVKKFFPVFAGLCMLALPFVVFSALSHEPEDGGRSVQPISLQRLDFDNNGNSIFHLSAQLSKEYVEGASSERTLESYYDRRQYPGSPPFIPHKVEADGKTPECLSCHAAGGWTEELLRHTPITPHPEQTSCRQCHVPMSVDTLFVETQWMSVRTPVLGRSHLPGAPPPIPHDLQMRGNCIACHVGPAAITGIRVSHADRGICRQCHAPDLFPGVFER